MSGPLQPSRYGEFHSRRLRLHYAEWGDPAQPLMIMLHGGLEHCRSWDWLARHFSQKYRVICPDLRGHGDSDHSPGGAYTVLDSVYDLYRLVRHLDASPAVLVGHSYGGNVATRYAALFGNDVRALVSIEGLSMGASFEPGNQPMPALHRLRAWYELQDKIDRSAPRQYATIDAAVTRVLDYDPLLPRETAEHVTRHGLRQNVNGTYSWKYDNLVCSVSVSDITPDELRSLWSAITCRVLLLNGKRSWASSPAADGRLAFFRDARVVEVEDAGHNLHHHQPELVATAIEAFLAGH